MSLKIGKRSTGKKKLSLQHRKLIAKAELKKLEKEEEKQAKNRRRYYLHSKARQFDLMVFATRREILITEDLNEKQAYYCKKLMEFGYNIQEAIS